MVTYNDEVWISVLSLSGHFDVHFVVLHDLPDAHPPFADDHGMSARVDLYFFANHRLELVDDCLDLLLGLHYAVLVAPSEI